MPRLTPLDLGKFAWETINKERSLVNGMPYERARTWEELDIEERRAWCRTAFRIGLKVLRNGGSLGLSWLLENAARSQPKLTPRKVYAMCPELKLACNLVVVDEVARTIHLYLDTDLQRMPVIPGYEVRMYPN